MREDKLKRLRDAYFGPLTAAQIAGAAGVGEKWLLRFWVREKAAGRLPDQRRPQINLYFSARRGRGASCPRPSAHLLAPVSR